MRPLTLLTFILLLPAHFAAGQDPLPFEPDDTLEEIRYKIDYNGYSFEVADNWVFSLSPEEKSRFFSRRAPVFPRAMADGAGIGPLGSRLESVDLPEKFDWRDYNGHAYIGDIRDQGSCGSCYAFGACAAAEGTYNFATGKFDTNCADFSESYIIWCLGRLSAYSSDFFGCDGASYAYMELEALTKEGIGNESDFPYTISDPDSCTHWGDQTTVFQEWHRVPCGDIDAIKTAIMTYGVVDAAVLAEDAFSAYDSGIYEDSNTSCNGTPCSYTTTNHAIALVGWDDSPPEGGGGCWILRNSWGDSWGENGYMRIRYTSAAVACAVCYLVYEPAASPTPTPVGYFTPTPTPSITPTPEGFQTPTSSPTPTASPTPAPQSIPFSEDFEGGWAGGAPEGWTREYLTGATDWLQGEGSDGGEIPLGAHGGQYNALIYYGEYSTKSTRLITPRIDFGEQTNNATLTFWHTQGEWSPDHDTMSVYYRVTEGGEWNLLTYYPDAVDSWTQRTLALPDPCSTYWISFVGTTAYGWGVCIDDLLITGHAYSPTPPTATVTPTPFAPPPATSTPPSGTGTPTPPAVTPQPSATLPPPTPAPTCSVSCSYRVSGRVLDRDTAATVPNADVWLEFSDHETTPVYTSGPDGSYSIFTYDPHPPGIVLARAEHPDYLPGNAATQWACDTEISDVEIELERAPSATPTPRTTRTPAPTPTCGPPAERPEFLLQAGDYNGDGTADIGIFRRSAGLWAIREVTRTYFGGPLDLPVSGDYTGDGTSNLAIFRSTAGLWALRGVSRIYYGHSGDYPAPADYDGNGIADVCIFRPSAGLWSARGVTRTYFGAAGDKPVPGDYLGGGTDAIGIFRPSSGTWAIRGVTRIYFGGFDDWPLPGDYNGDGAFEAAVFRPWSTGLWAIRGVTRFYFGRCTDYPIRADFNGNGAADPGVFRQHLGFWTVRGITRAYFGAVNDLPVTR